MGRPLFLCLANQKIFHFSATVFILSPTVVDQYLPLAGICVLAELLRSTLMMD